jgi:hypothetical protein
MAALAALPVCFWRGSFWTTNRHSLGQMLDAKTVRESINAAHVLADQTGEDQD